MKLFLIVFFTCTAVFCLAQPAKFKWAKQMGSDNGSCIGFSVCTDAMGNVYTTGTFVGTVDFNPGPSVLYLHSPVDKLSMFVLKLDSSGAFLWIKEIRPLTNDVSGYDITLDPFGNLYVTGAFTGTTDFDPDSGTFFLTNEVGPSGFVCKLDANGSFIWAKRMGQGGIDGGGGLSIVVDGAGNSYTAGYFGGISDLDPGPGVVLRDAGFYNNAYILKLSPSGDFIWVVAPRMIDNTASVAKRPDITLDAAGNVYCTGIFAHQVDFDPGPGNYTLSSSIVGAVSTSDCFIWKVSSTGQFMWAKQVGGSNGVTGLDEGISIVSDLSGNIYYSARFTGAVDFDPGNGVYQLVSTTAVTSAVSKLNSNGDFLWARLTPAGFLSCDAVSNVYIAGHFFGTVDFDPGPAVFELTSIGIIDTYITRIKNNGDYDWTQHIRGPSAAHCVSVDAVKNIYTTGEFYGLVDFDPGILDYNLTSFSTQDAFVHKMSQCISSASSVSVTDCKPYILNGTTYTTTGVYTQTITNSAGCDSLITLNLIITSPFGMETITSCNSYVWNNIIYTASGTYSTTLRTPADCDSIATLYLVINPGSFTELSHVICAGQSYNGHTIAGTYTDTFRLANGCDSLIKVHLAVKQKPVLNLGPDRELCAGDSIRIIPGPFLTYRWQDGTSSSSFLVTKPGSYSLTVTDNCGSATDDIQITSGNCIVYFPTGFSPNKDGVNDVFRILGAMNLLDYRLSIYNRWGKKIFETNDPSKGWDGTLNGKLVPEGAYVWYSSLRQSGISKKMKGVIIILK